MISFVTEFAVLPSDNDPSSETLETVCPSCGQLSQFTYIGEQRWSKAVAAAAGLPEVIYLYVCSSCQSSISLPPLEDEE